jgi:hypothetical protein
MHTHQASLVFILQSRMYSTIKHDAEEAQFAAYVQGRTSLYTCKISSEKSKPPDTLSYSILMFGCICTASSHIDEYLGMQALREIRLRANEVPDYEYKRLWS